MADDEDAYADTIVRLIEADEFYEAVAAELVRAGSVRAARLSLLTVIEQDDAGRWHLIANSMKPKHLLDLAHQNRRAEEAMAVGRSDRRGVPHATLESWIKNELRPRGLLAPSAGPGRPRRGRSKYEPGPTPLM